MWFAEEGRRSWRVYGGYEWRMEVTGTAHVCQMAGADNCVSNASMRPIGVPAMRHGVWAPQCMSILSPRVWSDSNWTLY